MSRSFRELTVGPAAEPTTTTILMGLLIAISIVVGLYFVEPMVQAYLGPLPIGLIVVVVGIGVSTTYLITYDERLWLATALLSTIGLVVIGEDSEGLSPSEFLFHLYGTFGVILWIVKELVVRRRPFIISSYDFLFATSFGLCLIVSVTTFLLYNGDAVLFIKEVLSFSTFLFYFPIRKMMRDDRHVVVILTIFVLITLINGVVNIVNYQERVLQSALMYGEVNARAAANESYSGLMTCLGAAIIVFARKKWLRWIGLGIFSIGAGLLIITLSRGPIVAVGIGIVVSLIFASARRAARLMIYAIVGFIINVGLAYVIFPDFVDSIFSNIESRFATLERIGTDKSLSSRFDEYAALTDKYIPASPLIGYGFGVPFTYYNKPFGTSASVFYTHNGYLHALYKFGLPAGLLLLFVLLVPLLRAPYSSYSMMSSQKRLFFGFAISGLVSLLIINFTSNSIYTTMTLLLWVVVLAIMDYLRVDVDNRHGLQRVGLNRSDITPITDGAG